MKAFFRQKILPSIVFWLYYLWTKSWRVRLIGAPHNIDGRPSIFAHWHGDELAIVHLVAQLKIATMTSTSSDGSLIDYVIKRLGGATSRGSSTRGAVGALKGLIRLLRSGHNASMAVDGPKGPIYKVKPGVFELNRLVRSQVIPIGVAASHFFIFQKSWNKAKLPLPFSRVVVFFGSPFEYDILDDPRSQEIANQLELLLSDAHHQAAKLIADL